MINKLGKSLILSISICWYIVLPTVSHADDVDHDVAADAIKALGGHIKNDGRSTFVDLSSTEVTDNGLANISKIKNLKMLNISDTRVTDAGLAHLAGLKGLRVLNLSSTTVTDAGLKQLAELENLESLYLIGFGGGDAGLKHLSNLKKTLNFKRFKQRRDRRRPDAP